MFQLQDCTLSTLWIFLCSILVEVVVIVIGYLSKPGSTRQTVSLWHKWFPSEHIVEWRAARARFVKDPKSLPYIRAALLARLDTDDDNELLFKAIEIWEEKMRAAANARKEFEDSRRRLREAVDF